MKKGVFLLISLGFYFALSAQELQPRLEQFDFYTDEIRAVATHIPEQPDGRLKENPAYVDQMLDWAKQYGEEYQRARMIKPGIALFEPFSLSTNANGKEKMSPDKRPHWLNPPFMRYPVTKDKPFFIGGIDQDMDSLTYRNKLQHWYYLHDTVNYKLLYGERPVVKVFPKPIHHPDELLEKEKQYYPEFYN